MLLRLPRLPWCGLAVWLAVALGTIGCGQQPVREDRSINWSKEGQQVGFQHGPEGVFVAGKDGGGLTKIFQPGADVLAVSSPLWSPTARRAIFTTARDAQGRRTVNVPLVAGENRRLGQEKKSLEVQERLKAYSTRPLELPADDHIGQAIEGLKVPVHSMVILLRPKARHPNVSGTVHYESRPGRGKMDFHYEVIELWQRPAEHFLAGPLGVLPLAPLGQLQADLTLEDGLAQVIDRLVDRLQREATPSQAAHMLTAAYVLTGLRIERARAWELFRRISVMRESDTQNQKILLRLGRKRFGEPDAATRAALEAITDLQRLEQLSERLLEVDSWSQLLHTT